MSLGIQGPRCNRQVSCSASANNARSESSLAINPLNPLHLVGASKKFTIPGEYAFSLICYASFDGGLSWTESAPLALQNGWDGVSDPIVVFRKDGVPVLIALPFFGTDPIAVAAYISPDGGLTWNAPILIHAAFDDDKPGAACDLNAPGAYGKLYVVWDTPYGGDSSTAYAESLDGGQTWQGLDGGPTGTLISADIHGKQLLTSTPEVAVGPDGRVYVSMMDDNAADKIYLVAKARNDVVFQPALTAASGITSLQLAASNKVLSSPDGFPELPGAKFRVLSFPALCALDDGGIVIAWADYRDNVSRIYYSTSTDSGATWNGGSAPSGLPLLTGTLVSQPQQHEFHPQLAGWLTDNTPNIANFPSAGCAFYRWDPGVGRIDTMLACGPSPAESFPFLAPVTDQSWDPTVGAPLSHGSPNTTFIGDYFGFAVSRMGFFPFWTDTRTGIQEIFTSRLCPNQVSVYMRDSASDTGVLPDPGATNLSPDVVLRWQPDGLANFVDQGLPAAPQDVYVYYRVTNGSSSPATGVRCAAACANRNDYQKPLLGPLNEPEFSFPYDWFAGNWITAADQEAHIDLGITPPVQINPLSSEIFAGPIWAAADLPDLSVWDPSLLVTVIADSDPSHDATSGAVGCNAQAASSCGIKSFFWGTNKAVQRDLALANEEVQITYTPVHLGKKVQVGQGTAVTSAGPLCRMKTYSYTLWATPKNVTLQVQPGLFTNPQYAWKIDGQALAAPGGNITLASAIASMPWPVSTSMTLHNVNIAYSLNPAGDTLTIFYPGIGEDFQLDVSLETTGAPGVVIDQDFFVEWNVQLKWDSFYYKDAVKCWRHYQQFIGELERHRDLDPVQRSLLRTLSGKKRQTSIQMLRRSVALLAKLEQQNNKHAEGLRMGIAWQFGISEQEVKAWAACASHIVSAVVNAPQKQNGKNRNRSAVHGDGPLSKERR